LTFRLDYYIETITNQQKEKSKMQNSNIITAEYNSSVLVGAGWRSVTIKAELEKITEKRAKVSRVLEVDGETSLGWTSRTGARRQQYNSASTASRETGKVKIISKLNVL
jgi:hypothetical protein